MAMRATNGSPAAGRSADGRVWLRFRRCHRLRARRPEEEGRVKVPPPSGEGSNRRLLIDDRGGRRSSSSLRPRICALRWRRQRDAAQLGDRAQAARGRRVHRPDREGPAVERSLGPDARGHVDEVEHLAPDERAALPDAGDLGLLHRAAAAGQVVHNLEHGGIFIQYGKDVPQATVDQLKAFYDSHQNGTLLAPLASLGSKIAIGVWTTKSATKPDNGTAYLAKCTTFDEAAYAAFFKAYQFKGPGAVPDDLAPARLVGRSADGAGLACG